MLYFPDVMPTLAEITRAECPKTDGLSFLPSLFGKGGQKNHRYLYWEYVGQTAVRTNQWKAWKAYKGKKGDWELYDLLKDVEEKENVAASNAGILKQLVAYAKEAHEPVRGGTIFDKTLTDKDHRQAPHGRNLK